MTMPQPPRLPEPPVTTCYRHPGREAGRACTRCGRPACAECLTQAAIGSHCPECAKASRPDAATRVRYWNARQNNIVTMTLIAINLAVFVWVLAGPQKSNGLCDRTIAQRQCDIGLAKQFLVDGEWYRLVTAGFLHFNVLHIALNMYLLFVLGRMLEPSLGRVRFALVYFAALLGGSLGAIILEGGRAQLVGGASGAIFGLMAAAAVGMHRRGVNPFSTGIGTTLLLNLVITFTVRGISIGGHLGGAAAGAICGAVVLAPPWKAMPKWASYAAPVAVGVVAIIASVVIAG